MKYFRQKCNKVPGTSRKEWLSPDGDMLQYRNVYLRPYAWNLLADLARGQGISGSEVIERLITEAAGFRIAIQR